MVEHFASNKQFHPRVVRCSACATLAAFGLLYHASSCQQIPDVQVRSCKTNSQRRDLFCHLHSLISSPCGYACVQKVNLTLTLSQRYATEKCNSTCTWQVSHVFCWRSDHIFTAKRFFKSHCDTGQFNYFLVTEYILAPFQTITLVHT